MREPPRFLVEELLPFSQPEETAANRPLPLDDPEAVWWITGGQVDVFFTLLEPGRRAGPEAAPLPGGGRGLDLRHQRRPGPIRRRPAGRRRRARPQLLKFARGDLIRLSFEERLAEQVALLIDDWLLRVGRGAEPFDRAAGRAGAAPRTPTAELEAGTRFGVRGGRRLGPPPRGYVRASSTRSRCPSPSSRPGSRSPSTSGSRPTRRCRVTACDTADHDPLGRPLGGLDDFHRAVLDYIGADPGARGPPRWAELQTAVARRAALVARALGTARRRGQRGRAADRAAGPTAMHLLAACRAVGRELGIEVRPPRESDRRRPASDGDPLGEIARASGFHVRRSRCPQDWSAARRRAAAGPALRRGRAGPWPCSPSDRARPVRVRGLRALRSGRRIAAGPSTSGSRADRARPPGCSIGPLPDQPLGLRDLLRFSLPRGRPRDWAGPGRWPCSAGLLGLVDADRVGHPGRPGHPRGRPSRRRGRYPPRLAAAACSWSSWPSRPRSSRRSRAWWSCASRGGSSPALDPGGLGSPAPAPHAGSSPASPRATWPCGRWASARSSRGSPARS